MKLALSFGDHVFSPLSLHPAYLGHFKPCRYLLTGCGWQLYKRECLALCSLQVPLVSLSAHSLQFAANSGFSSHALHLLAFVLQFATPACSLPIARHRAAHPGSYSQFASYALQLETHAFAETLYIWQLAPCSLQLPCSWLGDAVFAILRLLADCTWHLIYLAICNSRWLAAHAVRLAANAGFNLPHAWQFAAQAL